MANPAGSPESASRLDLADALAVNLNAIIGAGVFVALGIAADTSGPALLVAVCLAGALATLTAAASAPIVKSSRNVARGISWLTLMAGLPAAAAAAQMFSAYVAPDGSTALRHSLAVALIVATAALLFGGAKSTARMDGALLAVKIGALAFLVGLCVPLVDRSNFHRALPEGGGGVWKAAALLIFAYAGFGRSRDRAQPGVPRIAGPAAVLIAAALYMVVAFAAIGLSGLLFSARDLAGHAYNAPLLIPAAFTNFPVAARAVIVVGAVAAAISLLITLLEDSTTALGAWTTSPISTRQWPAMVVALVMVFLTSIAPIHSLIAFSAAATLALFAVQLIVAGGAARWILAVLCAALMAALPATVLLAAAIAALCGVASAAMAARARPARP